MAPINRTNATTIPDKVSPSQSMNWDAALTHDQQTRLDRILTRYDPENMTDEDFDSILDEIEALKSSLKETNLGRTRYSVRPLGISTP